MMIVLFLALITGGQSQTRSCGLLFPLSTCHDGPVLGSAAAAASSSKFQFLLHFFFFFEKKLVMLSLLNNDCTFLDSTIDYS